MISYREAREEIDTLPWPHGVSYFLTSDMMYLTIMRSSVLNLNALDVLQFKDCVDRAMAFLHKVNPAVSLRIV